MRELLRDIMRDVGADYALYDEVHDLELTTKEAVDQALLKSENFRRAQAAQAAQATREENIFGETDVGADSYLLFSPDTSPVKATNLVQSL